VTLHVQIEEQPNDFGSAAAPAPRQPLASPGSVAIAAIGVDVADLTDTMAEDLGFAKGTHGVAITRVEPNGLAADAGLRKGMLIAKVDSQKVTSAAQVQQALQTATLQRGVLLQVQSPQGGVNFILLKNSAGASE
jgi:S1-C subfamily serine protease